MPFNLLKVYNQQLDLLHLNKTQRTNSLLGIFDRDICNNPSFLFRQKPIYPTPTEDGEVAMETLFNHLTRKITNKSLRQREFDIERSCRLHWVRHHIENKKKENMLCFSVKEPNGIRTYLYDIVEKYVIVLEPLRDNTAYFLITAFPLLGKDRARDSIMKKYKRKLNEVY